MRPSKLLMKPLRIFGQPMFNDTETKSTGSRFNKRLTMLMNTARGKGNQDLANLYNELISRGLKDSDAVVEFIKGLNPETMSSDDLNLLDRCVTLPMNNGLVVHLDIAGESALKFKEIRGEGPVSQNRNAA